MYTKQDSVPPEFLIYKLASGKSPSDITLRSTEWAVITQLDDKKTVKDIAKILAMTKSEAIELFKGLEDKGLIEVIASRQPMKKIVPISFFNILEEELLKIIGPVAPFLIQDALFDVGTKKNDFTVAKVAELIEVISDEISDEQKNVLFQKVMLEQIKEMEIG